jgi:hypothetical protein
MAKDKKLPALQWYPGDWRKDLAVQSLSFHDRGVWFEMLMLMHDSENRGSLVLNGRPMSDEMIARAIGLDNQIFNQTLTTLLTSGVAERDLESGAITNRRMVRDEHIRKIRVEVGKKGGNPNLVNQTSNQNPTTQVNQKPTPSSSSSVSSSEEKEELSLLSPEAATGPKPNSFPETWNALCGALPKVKEFSDSRRKKVQARIRQGISIETFESAVRACTEKPFLRGENDRGWTATFDWLIDNDRNIEKAITDLYGLKAEPVSRLAQMEFVNGGKRR